MTHDPLCPCAEHPDPNNHWHDHGGNCSGCECDGIAIGRKAERDGINRDGQRDMLAKCIAAVEAIPHDLYDDTGVLLDMAYIDAINDALAALRALGGE